MGQDEIRFGERVGREAVLPFPPSVNNYYAVVRGRKILSKRGREYKRGAAQHLLVWGLQRIEGPVWVELLYVPPDRRRRDLDNLLKPVLDSLTEAGIYGDDSQVKIINAEMAAPDKHEPRCVVRIGKLDIEREDQ